jgi:hypothetical protein
MVAESRSPRLHSEASVEEETSSPPPTAVIDAPKALDQEDAGSAAAPQGEKKQAKKRRKKKKAIQGDGAAADVPVTETTALTKSNDSSARTNELTKLIPGYIAPLKLASSSLDVYRKPAMTSALAAPSTTTTTSFKTGKRRTQEVDDAGAGWFGMRATPMTEQVKQDMTLIRNRNYLDPKRFYKSSDTFGKFLQAGTVIEGAAEFYSSRLTKKQRKSSLVQEVMADPSVAAYAQGKFRKMAQAKTKATQKRLRTQKPSSKSKRGRA